MGSGSMARNTAAKSANATPASFVAVGTVPNSSIDSNAVIKGAPAFVKGDTTMAFP